MEFTSFTSLVREEVEKIAGEDYKVKLNNVRKNNSVVLCGITLTQDDSNISPTIYLDNYYKAYEEGRATIDYVVNDVIDTYNKNRINRNVDIRNFMNYEVVKKHIVYKLVNTEKNRELLKDVPHIEFLDLSIVFQCLIINGEYGTATILIHNAHLKLWDISVEELYKTAVLNTPKLQNYEIKGMKEVICEIMRAENPDNFDYKECMEDMSDSVAMYVLSNKSRLEGAACILYPNLIKDFSRALKSSFYIIPASIHEVLLLPSEYIDECEEIEGMIKEINDTQVKQEEILSYSVYYYDKFEEKIIKL